MKTAWETKRLADFSFSISTGPFGSVLHKSDYVTDGVPLVNPINIVDGEIIPDPSKLIGEETKQRLRDYVLRPGDVVVARRGEIGRCAVVGVREAGWVCGTGSFFIRPLPSLDSRFLAHLIRSSRYRQKLEKMSTGATIQSLSNTALRDLLISVPARTEQLRIVALLEKAFADLATAKANAEDNLLNARALFEVLLQSVFNGTQEEWAKRRLGDLAEIQSGGTPLVSKKEFWSGGIPWYSSGELNAMTTSDPERQISSAGLANSNAKLFPKGSLLIGMYDTAALKMSILDREAAFNQAIAGVKPSEHVDVEFALHAINAKKPELLLERRGVRQKNLSLGKIKDIVIPVPSLRKQRDIVSLLRMGSIQTHQLETVYRTKVEALDELKLSLLRQAFTGAL